MRQHRSDPAAIEAEIARLCPLAFDALRRARSFAIARTVGWLGLSSYWQRLRRIFAGSRSWPLDHRQQRMHVLRNQGRR